MRAHLGRMDEPPDARIFMSTMRTLPSPVSERAAARPAATVEVPAPSEQPVTATSFGLWLMSIEQEIEDQAVSYRFAERPDEMARLPRGRRRSARFCEEAIASACESAEPPRVAAVEVGN